MLVLAPFGASTPDVVTQAACEGAPAAELFAQWDSQLENLAFDGLGNLYATDLGADRLVRFDTDGEATVILAADGVHGLVRGPDGDLYMGAAPDGSGGATGMWQVWHMTDLTPGAATHDVIASGIDVANGLAFDAEGNLYVSNPLGTRAPYLVKLPAGDPADWAEFWGEYGPNGLWYDAGDDSLLAAITADQSSTIVRIPVADPDAWTIVADLSFGAVTLQPGAHAPRGIGQPLVFKGLDDLTLAPDGLIYATGHVSGELLRVDPADGSACVMVSGLEEPTSVRVAEGFGAYDGDLFVTDMGGVGVTALATPGAGAVWRVPMDG